ncbi:MAG TPA: PIN domain-containing protein [Thermoanaerobaculia bacterium]|nr:PIN domain-containing protein [Thermoanaerobaculia bacterium]
MTAAPAVIDTNVVVAGLLTEVSSSPTARILDGMLAGRFRFLLSVELLAEYRDVLLRPKIQRRHQLAQGEVDVLLTEIAANGVALEVESPAGGSGRKGDDHLRRILSAEPSALLVTGDLRLTNQLGKTIKVLTPREFADLMGD